MTTANRLTLDDENTIGAAIEAAVDEGTHDTDTLAAIGYRAIGCTDADMRDTEREFVRLTATYAVALHAVR